MKDEMTDDDTTTDEDVAQLLEAARQYAMALSSPPRTIACEDVREGDIVYDSPSEAGRTGSWMRVKSVDPPDGRDNVWIHGVRWSTCGHRRQGIAVKRARWEE